MLAGKWTKAGRGKVCGQTDFISIWQAVLVHRIVEYGQQEIQLKLNLYDIILQRLLCGVGLRRHLS